VVYTKEFQPTPFSKEVQQQINSGVGLETFIFFDLNFYTLKLLTQFYYIPQFQSCQVF